MATRGWKSWRGARIFFVVDEGAILEQFPVKKSDNAGIEANHSRLVVLQARVSPLPSKISGILSTTLLGYTL
jgi:hypothetical protein